MCNDTRCTDGITWCADCNGWGVLNPAGRKYRLKCKQVPAWAVPHDGCHGTGLRECGCVELADAERLVLSGRAVQVPA